MESSSRFLSHVGANAQAILARLAGGSDRDFDEQRRRAVLAVFMLLGVAASYPFGLFHLMLGHTLRAIPLLVVGSLQLASLLVLRYLKRLLVVYRLNVAFVGAYLLFILVEGNTSGSGILWLILYPVFVFFLLGKREGAIWSSLLYFASLILLVVPFDILEVYPYPEALKVRYLAAYALIALMSYIVEATRHKHQHNILEMGEEALVRSEERFRELAELLPETIYEMDDRGVLTFVNRSAFDQFGYGQDDFAKGLHALDMLAREDRERAAEVIGRTMEGQKGGLNEYTALRKDGSTFPVLIRSTPILREGKPVGMRGIIIDISDKKQLESQLIQAQKMEAVGTLAGGIAHDFNNILMGIQGRTSLMLMDLPEDHDHYDHLAGIEEYVRNATQLTKQLLGFARGGKYQVKPTNLNKLVAESSNLFGRTKKEILIHSKLQEDLWTVESDQAQMEQVLLNLYVNAWQAMPSGGSLYLQTANVYLDDKQAGAHGVNPGRFVRISVTDTGVGMSESTQRRIFDPFFTTKERGRGTGLGLASAYGIVSNHGGFIDVSSEKGSGSIFQVYLPATDKDIVPERVEREEPLRGRETVLLVDDEELILDVGQQMLSKLGYNVLIARNGEEAVDIYEKMGESIAIVILDMIMPRMSGGAVFDRLRDIDPDLKALLSSGYSIDGEAKEILARGCDGFIQKPFTLGDISRSLRNILDKQS